MASKFLPIESQLRKEGFFLVAGIDEAGRGPLAGPVVSAAVILKQHARIPGLTDSKKLSAKKREELFPLVIKNCIDYAISISSHSLIDEVNILNATRIANDLCIRSLKFQPHIALCDGRDKQILSIPFKNFIKGDSKVKSIAAASILAKVLRDKLMTQYCSEFPDYGFSKHMGYGTREHRSQIAKLGLCDIHRRSYTCKSLS